MKYATPQLNPPWGLRSRIQQGKLSFGIERGTAGQAKLKAEGSKQESQNRGQMTEVRGQRSEVGGQGKTEVRGQRSEVGDQRTEDSVSEDTPVEWLG